MVGRVEHSRVSGTAMKRCIRLPARTAGGVVVGVFLSIGSAHAGMTVYDLNDIVRLRLEDISFFALLLVLAALGVRRFGIIWPKIFRGCPACRFFRL